MVTLEAGGGGHCGESTPRPGGWFKAVWGCACACVSSWHVVSLEFKKKKDGNVKLFELGFRGWGIQPAGSLAPLLLVTLQPPALPPLAGIIDLSQVPHLPVLVPPTPGTPATTMDRLTYLPTAPQHFSSRLSSSPLSPGDAPTPLLGAFSSPPWKTSLGPFLSPGLNLGPLGFQEAPLT